jgi:DNA-directed RNA polymerase sigma subunit (sigma70/sigma32)
MFDSMKTLLPRRIITKRELGLLSASLRPVRSFEEVGQIMGLSSTAVSNIENSALRKIIMALNPPQAKRRRQR